MNKDFIHWKELTIAYRRDSVDKNVIDHSFDNDIFYSTAKEFRPRQNMTILDVGAHIGTFSLLTTQKFPDAKIIALEPFPETYKLLSENVKNNALSNIVPLEAALSSNNEEIKLYVGEDNWEHSTIYSGNNKWVRVKSVNLSSLFNELKFDTIDLIKFNCEGAEFQIFQNLEAEVLSKINMMIILFHEDAVQDYDRRDITRVLAHNDFMFRIINTSEKRGWIIAKANKNYSSIENELVKLGIT